MALGKKVKGITIEFNGDTTKDTETQAAELMAKIPASKRAKALELLEALAM